MAAPSIGSGTVTGTTPNSTSHSIPAPTGLAVGDMWVALVVTEFDSAFATASGTGGTWVQPSGAAFPPASPNKYLHAFYKVVTSATATLTVTTTGSISTAYISFRIPAADGPVAAETVAASAFNSGGNPDPPTLAANTSAKDTLYIAVEAHSGAGVATAAPSGYSGFTTKLGSSTGLGMAWRKLNASTSTNPGVFTASNFGWGAMTLAFVSAPTDSRKASRHTYWLS